jgi:phenylacetate-CoA ligase
MAGLAYYLGGLKVGARMVRGGAGSSAMLWRTVKATGATVIVGVPSFIRKIASYAIKCGESPEKSNVRLLVAIGESIRDSELKLLPSAKRAEDLWSAPIYSTYASTEMATAFCECTERIGGHLNAELVVVEVLDDKGSPVSTDETGEVVVTPLGITGMPLVRFRTGDISFLIDAPCPCGRNTPRLGPILGRKNQMLKYKGTTVFPSFLVVAAEALESVSGAYVEAWKGTDGTDEVRLYVAMSDDKLTLDDIEEYLRACVRVLPEIRFVSEDEYNEKVFSKEKRKRTTFFDLR